MTVGLLSFSNPGWANIDGSKNAPTGTLQFPTLLSGYAARSPWSVPGVDYHVGIDRSLYPTNADLKNPATIPTSGSISRSGHVITVSAANQTVDGYDFSLSNGYSLLLNGVSGTTVTNCIFVQGSNLNYAIYGPAGCSNTTIKRCEFTGSSTSDSSSFEDAVNYAGTGTFVFEYNLVQSMFQHGLDFTGSGSGSSITPTVRFNVFKDIGIGTSAHADPWYYFNINMTGGLFAFNVVYQTQTVPTDNTGGANPGMFVGTDNFTTGITTSDTSLLNNTVIATGPTQSMTYCFWVINSTGNTLTNPTVSDNYFDATATYGVWNINGTMAGFVHVGNINMKTGVETNS